MVSSLAATYKARQRYVLAPLMAGLASFPAWYMGVHFVGTRMKWREFAANEPNVMGWILTGAFAMIPFAAVSAGVFVMRLSMPHLRRAWVHAAIGGTIGAAGWMAYGATGLDLRSASTASIGLLVVPITAVVPAIIGGGFGVLMSLTTAIPVPPGDRRGPFCSSCGYSLRGFAKPDRCPECGRLFAQD